MRQALPLLLTAALFLVGLLCGCVSTHVGVPAEVPASDLVVSCAPDPRVDIATVILLDCVFENRGPAWISVEASKLEPSAGATLSSPEDIAAVAEATAARESKDQWNRQVALGGVALGGLVLAVAGGGRASGAGLGIASGALAADAAYETSSRHDNAQHGPLGYGREHALSGPFRLPPQSFVRRAVLLEVEPAWTSRPDRKLGICVEQPHQACFDVRLTSPRERA